MTARRTRTARKTKRATRAEQAEKYALYEAAVQEPADEVRLIQRVFKRHHGRPARLLREDFCGTAALSCAWVRSHHENLAWGIDIDPEPLEWSRSHNVSALGPRRADRLTLVEGDVLDARHRRVDVTAAYNFSYLVFRERPQLLRYFRKVHSGLARAGLFMMDLYGGPDAQAALSERSEIEGFDYVWEQARFDPVHQRALNYIHFEFPDGSSLERAFTYDWRLWGLPELRDLLHEAGFRRTEVLWEGCDPGSEEGNGVYRPVESADDDPAWIVYLVAVK
ncbi:MAG: class I SAM-dependent methyltransferase [Deltaproteobacteria bacterium]|nr:class I SAM-dependent methyltransferase [Deltaproteobacteria bacterium]MBW2417943.1 class I SAM-dependent methyltransferase [Deltaproteobacteria bacterium]